MDYHLDGLGRTMLEFTYGIPGIPTDIMDRMKKIGLVEKTPQDTWKLADIFLTLNESYILTEFYEKIERECGSTASQQTLPVVFEDIAKITQAIRFGIAYARIAEMDDVKLAFRDSLMKVPGMRKDVADAIASRFSKLEIESMEDIDGIYKEIFYKIDVALEDIFDVQIAISNAIIATVYARYYGTIDWSTLPAWIYKGGPWIYKGGPWIYKGGPWIYKGGP